VAKAVTEFFSQVSIVALENLYFNFVYR
jgi:hypothetical protein